MEGRTIYVVKLLWGGIMKISTVIISPRAGTVAMNSTSNVTIMAENPNPLIHTAARAGQDLLEPARALRLLGGQWPLAALARQQGRLWARVDVLVRDLRRGRLREAIQ